MIYLIPPTRRGEFTKELTRFFLIRYFCKNDAFSPHNNSKPPPLTDEFDTDVAVYLAYADSHYGLCAGLRMLPTTLQMEGPLGEPVWECSGFFIDLPRALPKFEECYGRIAQELLKGLRDYGASQSIGCFMTLLPIEIHQRLSQNGWPLKVQGTPALIKGIPFIQSMLEVPENLKKDAA